MKMNYIILFLFGVSLCACFEDKGNYDYRDMADITIENIPEVIEVLGNSDHIVVSPKVVSSLDGVVKEGDANLEFTYKICLLYTFPSPRDRQKSRMPSSA